MKSFSNHLSIFAVILAIAASADAQAASNQSAAEIKKTGFFSKVFKKKTEAEKKAKKAERERARDRRTRSRKKGGFFRSRTKTEAPKPETNPYVVNQRVLDQSNRANTQVIIDISQQRAYLLVDGKTAIKSPISSARPGKYTPTGTFHISERVRTGKISTIYHVSMPYWMRLSSTEFGVHAGYLPGYPASAGCVRLPHNVAQMIYDHTRSGTPVRIHQSWRGS